MPHRVAFLGFTESERHALSSYLRLAQHRSPSYTHVSTLTDADLLVADADHAPSVQLVVVTERTEEAVFIGAQAPAGSAAWMRRPIDALQVMRELDGIVARRRPNPEAPSPTPVSLAALPSGLPRALLVGDRAGAMLDLRRRLDRWHVQIDGAFNSQAALGLLAKHSFDLVFLDVELGQDSELDGLGLCQHIKQTPASISALVVMVNAHHSELDRVRCALAGCDAYFSKPLAEAEWVRLLQRQGLRQKAEAGSIPG